MDLTIPCIDSSIEVAYVVDSSDMEEYEIMIENMKKELLLCKLKINYLERIILNSRHSRHKVC
jgi:alpha-D-ribose 1-methylphosphonate 5-phosphate C-P lyase